MIYFKILSIFYIIELSVSSAEYVHRYELNDCNQKLAFNNNGFGWLTPSKFFEISSISNNHNTTNDTILQTKVYYNGASNFYLVLSDQPREYKNGDTVYEICKYIIILECYIRIFLKLLDIILYTLRYFLSTQITPA